MQIQSMRWINSFQPRAATILAIFIDSISYTNAKTRKGKKRIQEDKKKVKKIQEERKGRKGSNNNKTTGGGTPISPNPRLPSLRKC